MIISKPVRVGAAVRVDLDDTSLLGEVCHCSGRDGHYLCGIVVDQVLSGVKDLARLMDAILGARVRGAGDEISEVETEVIRVRKRRNAT